MTDLNRNTIWKAFIWLLKRDFFFVSKSFKNSRDEKHVYETGKVLTNQTWQENKYTCMLPTSRPNTAIGSAITRYQTPDKQNCTPTSACNMDRKVSYQHLTKLTQLPWKAMCFNVLRKSMSEKAQNWNDLRLLTNKRLKDLSDFRIPFQMFKHSQTKHTETYTMFQFQYLLESSYTGNITFKYAQIHSKSTKIHILL